MALLLVAAGVRAEFTASVDRSELDESELLTLTLQFRGDVGGQTPDLSPLETDFEIRGQSSSTQVQIFNGNTDATVTLELTLAPRRRGTLRIPPLALAGERTDPITIVVRDIDPALRRQVDSIVFFESSVEPARAWVQAQVTYVRRLYYAADVQLHGELPDAPAVADAMVQPLGDATPDTIVRDGVRYGVIEQRFAIFPQRSGRLEIPPASIQGSVRIEDAAGRRQRRGVRVTAEAHTVDVLPQPADYPSQAAFLPALDVRLEEEFDTTGQLDAGTPLVRTLRLSAVGLPASALPELAPPVPAPVRVYAEAPELRERTDGERILATRTQRFTLVPGAGGTFDLPEVVLPWFDVATGSLRTARLPSRTLRVQGPALARQPAPAAAVTSPADAGAPAVTAPAPAAPDTSTAPAATTPWVAACALLAIGWAATAALWLRQRRHFGAPSRAPNTLAMARRGDVERAARANDAATARSALAAWLAVHWRTNAATALLRARGMPPLAACVADLDAALYRDPPVPWDGRALLAVLPDIDRNTDEESGTRRPLPPLYPDSYPNSRYPNSRYPNSRHPLSG
jgi:hypothetical protein